MKKEADKNFITHSAKKDKYEFHNYREFIIEGLPFYEENQNFTRLPIPMVETFTENMQEICKGPTGVVIRFRTNSHSIALYCEYDWKRESDAMSQLVDAGFDLYKFVAGEYRICNNFRPGIGEAVLDMETAVSSDDAMYDYMLYLPLCSWVRDFDIGIEKGAVIEEGSERHNKKKILFYGSSVTHGACASRPGLTYPATLGRMLECEIINMGFSGNCLGEECIARKFGEFDYDLFVMEYGYNAETVEYFESTHEPFFKIMREHHPDVPVIFITRPEFNHITTPIQAGIKAVIKNTYENAVNSGDKRVYYIDGRDIFPDYMRGDYSTPENVHPNDRGMFEIAKAVYEIAKEYIK